MRSKLAGSVFIGVFSSILLTPGAVGQISFGKDAVDAEPLGLSISGGISLGSYQAGVNFGLLEIYRHAAWNTEFRRSMKMPLYRLRTVTGASAGNINTLLWAVEACTDLRPASEPYRSPDPDSSLFWQVWLEIGWDRLFNRDSDELALFDRAVLTDSIADSLLTVRMRDPRLVEGCRVPAGITLTRIEPDTLWLQNLPIVTQRHVTAFTMRVDSDSAEIGTRVRFLQETRIKPTDQYFGILVRLEPHDGDIPFGSLLQAVKASASFPVAFAPVELDVWYPAKQAAERHAFVDGGAFDNNPVGLARNLYGLQNDHDTLDILYVNPYRHRGELQTQRLVRGERAPSGGLAAVMATLAGAVPTARQYELQLLARERAHQDLIERLRPLVPAQDRPRFEAETRGSSVQERLLLSSRAYPVLGEHLGSFGAFLARPGREFDFYVGIYDAFYMAVSEHSCGHHPDSTALGRQQRHRCAGLELRRLIQSRDLVRDPGRQVLAWLYEREYGPTGLPAPEPPADSMQDRVTVQRALFNALGTQFAPVDAWAECHDTRLVFAVLCADGLWEVLTTLRGDTAAVRIIGDWSSNCDNDCKAEPVFWKLIDNPMAAATTTMDDVIERLRDVEVRMKTRPGLTGGNYVAPVTAGQWLFYASHLRSRLEWDWVPNSVPDSRWYRRIPISYIGANLGTSGIEARWQPTWNVGNPLFVRGNLIAHYNGQPLFSEHRVYGGVGIMGGAYLSKVVISELGVGVNVFHSIGRSGEGAAIPYELEGSAVVVANQLRFGIRWLPDGDHRGLLHGTRGWAFAVGLNDPVGLLHWMASL